MTQKPVKDLGEAAGGLVNRDAATQCAPDSLHPALGRLLRRSGCVWTVLIVRHGLLSVSCFSLSKERRFSSRGSVTVRSTSIFEMQRDCVLTSVDDTSRR